MTNSSSKPPIWFWIISVVALVWNGMGVNAYLQQAYKTESWKSSMTPEEIEIAANLPAWVTAAFAIAVFAAALGCIALLLRKKWANGLLVLSLIAVIAQMGYFFSQGLVTDMGMTIGIILVAIFLVWFARMSKAKGWLT